jgi:hypothetical protein
MQAGRSRRGSRSAATANKCSRPDCRRPRPVVPGRRSVLMMMGLGMVAGASGFAARHDGAASAAEPSLLPPEAKSLGELTARLSRAPRRRDFKTVPMILNDPDQWDHAALHRAVRGLAVEGGADSCFDGKAARARLTSWMTRRVMVFTIPNQNSGKEMPP